MRNIVFEITDNEEKVLRHYCMDPQDWIENAVGHLVELAKDKLYEQELERILDDPAETQLTTSRDDIVSNYRGPLMGNPNI